jgi:hypothetical protein
MDMKHESTKEVPSFPTKRIFLFATASLLLWFLVFDRFVPNQSKFQADSESLVRLSVERAIETGQVHHLGGFMMKPGGVYTAQVGLQYQVLAAIAPRAIGATPTFFALARIVTALLSAMVLALFISSVGIDYGIVASLVALVLVGGSEWLARFSMNLYWMIFLHLFPFVAAWSFYRPQQSRKQKGVLAAVLLMAILAKCLNGYEYISNILASVSVAIAYREAAHGAGAMRIFKQSLVYGLVGLGAFVLALAAHIAQGYAHFGNWDAALRAIVGPALDRTTGDRFGREVSLVNDLGVYWGYLSLRGPMMVKQGVIYVLAAATWFALGSKWGLTASETRAFRWAIVTSALATATWHVLAIGHMRYHLHINGITFYLPFNLVLCATWSAWLSTYISGRRESKFVGAGEA